MRKAIIITLVLLLGLFITTPYAAIILEDDFEDGDTSDWQTFSSAIIVPTSSYKVSGSYGGRMRNYISGGCGYEGPGKFAPAYKEFTPQVGVFSVEFYGMSDGAGGAYNWRTFGFSDQPPSIHPTDHCNRIDPNKFFVGGVNYNHNWHSGPYEFSAITTNDMLGQTAPLSIHYTPGQWDFFEFIIDVPNQQYTIYINETDAGTLPFYRSISSISTFMVSTEYKNVYIDDIKIYEGLPEILASLDIKPGSCPNPLNVKSKGVLPAAIMGTENLDVTQVDPDTLRLRLKGTEEPLVAPLRWAYADVGEPFEPFIGKEDCFEDCLVCSCPDGFLDLVFHFDRQEVIAAIGEVYDGDCLVLELTGNLQEEFDGTPIVGEDVVRILKKDKQ